MVPAGAYATSERESRGTPDKESLTETPVVSFGSTVTSYAAVIPRSHPIKANEKIAKLERVANTPRTRGAERRLTVFGVILMSVYERRLCGV